jgi:hypothetical protein
MRTREQRREYNHQHYLRHREERIAYAKACWREHKAEISERNRRARQDPVTGPLIREKDRESRRRNPPKRETQRRNAEAARLRNHGLTPDSYRALLLAQGEACAICREPFRETPRIDHDHETGEVRGLLCHRCNVALGLLRDDRRVIEAAAHYLGIDLWEPGEPEDAETVELPSRDEIA